jgi:hypothetical protein
MAAQLARVAICLALAVGCASTGSPEAPDGSAQGGAGGGGAGGNHMTEDGLTGTGSVSGAGSAGTGAAGTGGMLGSWLYSAGTTTRTCPGEAPTDAAPEGGLSIAAGQNGELVVTEACPLRFTVSGNVATVVSGQSCSGADGAGGQITFSKLNWTLTLSADGKSLAEALDADETLSPAGGPARTCRYTETGVKLRRP